MRLSASFASFQLSPGLFSGYSHKMAISRARLALYILLALAVAALAYYVVASHVIGAAWD
jgi:hypothetical protein